MLVPSWAAADATVPSASRLVTPRLTSRVLRLVMTCSGLLCSVTRVPSLPGGSACTRQRCHRLGRSARRKSLRGHPAGRTAGSHLPQPHAHRRTVRVVRQRCRRIEPAVVAVRLRAQLLAAPHRRPEGRRHRDGHRGQRHPPVPRLGIPPGAPRAWAGTQGLLSASCGIRSRSRASTAGSRSARSTAGDVRQLLRGRRLRNAGAHHRHPVRAR